MDFDYSIEYENSLIRLNTRGVLDFVQAFEMWEAVVAACKKFKCFRILGVSSVEVPVQSMDAYDHLSLLEAVGVTKKYRIAWTAVNPAVLERLRAIQTVIKNRSSLNVRVFESAAEAEQWIDDES